MEKILVIIFALTVVLGMTSIDTERKTEDGEMPPAMLRTARQMLIVTTPGWSAVDGNLRVYERAGSDQAWDPAGGAIPVVVGRSGLAWAPAVLEEAPGLARRSDPVKKEGDGKSPAGFFTLSSAFGYADRKAASGVGLRYRQATATLECVDDTRSEHYNRLVDRRETGAPDWKSSEQMRRQDEQYRWGVVVDHNYPVTRPGCGSCIFLHIWQGKGIGTAGCTAMGAGAMKDLLFRLDPEKKPVLVQLTETDYERLKGRWRLP